MSNSKNILISGGMEEISNAIEKLQKELKTNREHKTTKKPMSSINSTLEKLNKDILDIEKMSVEIKKMEDIIENSRVSKSRESIRERKIIDLLVQNIEAKKAKMDNKIKSQEKVMKLLKLETKKRKN